MYPTLSISIVFNERGKPVDLYRPVVLLLIHQSPIAFESGPNVGCGTRIRIKGCSLRIRSSTWQSEVFIITTSSIVVRVLGRLFSGCRSER